MTHAPPQPAHMATAGTDDLDDHDGGQPQRQRQRQPLQQRPRQRRRASSSGASSTTSWDSRGAAAAAAAPAADVVPRGRQDSTASSSSAASHGGRSCEGMTPAETRALWRCMLDLQRRYACYKSTRIDLALCAGPDALSLMPNPFIIDTLNSSVVDLPDEAWQELDRCHVRPGPSAPSAKRSLWSRLSPRHRDQHP